jgi:hypothetical protein
LATCLPGLQSGHLPPYHSSFFLHNKDSEYILVTVKCSFDYPLIVSFLRPMKLLKFFLFYWLLFQLTGRYNMKWQDLMHNHNMFTSASFDCLPHIQ